MARYSAEEKQEAHAAFEAILDQLDALQRQPDSWEESCLVHALSFMEAGIYDRARTAVNDCVTPVRLRQRLNQVKIEAGQR